MEHENSQSKTAMNTQWHSRKSVHGAGLWQAKAERADLREANLDGTVLAKP